MSTVEYRRAVFEPHVGSTFTVRADDTSPGTLTLDRLVETPSPEGHEQFALTFIATENITPVQGTRHLDHPDLGELDLFLVPVRQSEDGIEFEACINVFVAKD